MRHVTPLRSSRPYGPQPPEAPKSAPPPASPSPSPRPRCRRLRLRLPWVLVDDAFWTGVLTAICIAGLLAVIVATA
ncbi:hypothetical protein [Streptomyces sp. Root369]|uniref:hypothetical protein n=1 Tax=Streptomyces sp. Root369 TaxID=1736523 RepID=UPI00070B5B59|nr:hypothetical protein [Streptomyces sp. Root369]KQW16949.1 hypothetical protein ASD08_23780 [Streptomyces sp. Root369]